MNKTAAIFVFGILFLFTEINAQHGLLINITEKNNINKLYKKDLLINTLDSFFKMAKNPEKGIRYWEKTDLHFFGYPWDIANYGFNGAKQFLRPVFLGAIDIVPRKKYVVKIGYI